VATYAIGDVQGCYRQLRQLLKKIAFNPNNDQLWVAGDLVNRGPANLDSIHIIQDMGNSAKMVLGNHDLHLLAVAEGHKKLTRKDTLKDVLEAPDLQEIIQWLRKQPLMHQCTELGYSMVHAGIPPIWTIKQAMSYAKEVHNALKNDKSFDKFLANMYGNVPSAWQEELTGSDRLRLITNYFTRMRFCNAEGDLELDTKTEADTAPAGFQAWFSYKHHACAEQKVIFGHWASLLGKTDTANFIALDTGCIWGGKLTALRLDDAKYFSVAGHSPS